MLAQYERTATSLARSTVWKLGNPFSWPAPWWFALRTGAPPSRYDAAVGPMLLDGYKVTFQAASPELHADLWLADRRNDRFLVRFPSPRGAGREAVRPLVAPGARILVPLNILTDLGVRCEGTASAAGTLAARWNGHETARVALVAGQPVLLAFVVPAADVERELNLLDLDVTGVTDGAEAATLTRCALDAKR
jgi:hypothetical protein